MRLRALVSTSHPGPSVAITVMIMALTVRAAPHGVGPLAAAPALLAGEFSIGWSNDYFDADRDAAVGRTDKPLATGELSRRAVMTAALAALAVSLVLAFTINIATGVINLIATAMGWSYNAGLKSTLASGLTYAVGFGLIPAFAVSTLPGHPMARPWTLAAATLLGLGGHFANVLPDLDGDQATGVRGLPQRIAERLGPTVGPIAVRLIALVLLLGTSALIAFAPSGPLTWPRVTGFAVAVVLALVGARASGRTPFLAAIGIAGIDAALFAFGGVPLR